MKTRKLTEEFLKKWETGAEDLGVPKDSYDPRVRIIKSPNSTFSFAMFYNAYRHNRSSSTQGDEGCKLCNAVVEAKTHPSRVLYETTDFIVTPNKFPTRRGSSIAIYNQTGDSLPMYRTCDLRGLENLLNQFFEISRATNLQILHNSPGAGSSEPNHEHCNLGNFSEVYFQEGQIYGLDGARYEPVKVLNGIGILPDFPFASIVFQKEDSNRIVSFLKRLEEAFGTRFQGKGVPHGLSQGKIGLMITPAKVYVEGKGIGAGDMAGSLLTGNEDEFNTADYAFCVNKLAKTLFRKDEIDLTKFV